MRVVIPEDRIQAMMFLHPEELDPKASLDGVEGAMARGVLLGELISNDARGFGYAELVCKINNGVFDEVEEAGLGSAWKWDPPAF